MIGMVKEVIGINMLKRRVWYSLKYDREMLLPIEGDTDVQMMFKGNDEYGYLFVGGKDGPLQQEQAGVAICEGRVRRGDDGNACCRSGRNGHDGVEGGSGRRLQASRMEKVGL